MKAKYFIALLVIFFVFISAGCGGSGGGDVSLQNESGESTDTQELVNELIAEGVLNSDGTLPDSSINYNTSTSAKSLSKTTATQVTQGEALNPITLSLGFTTDIWRVYVNNSLAASAYSPGVSGSEISASENGVTISASSSTSATISFSTSAMST